jgi:hypothetical protein
VADNTRFDSGVWVRLGVKLQSENVGTKAKSLIAADGGRGEMYRTRWQIECVTMPMLY